MNHKRSNCPAAAYALAVVLLSMLVTFIAFDLSAVRREADLRYQDNCGAVAERACAATALQTGMASKDL
jgi:hypothetical protein